jgi:hypothetical protein
VNKWPNKYDLRMRQKWFAQRLVSNTIRRIILVIFSSKSFQFSYKHCLYLFNYSKLCKFTELCWRIYLSSWSLGNWRSWRGIWGSDWYWEEKTGKQFDNILSDSVAKENAIYYNKQSSSIYDTVTITTKLLAFLDVNEKIEYKKQQEEVSHHYITKSIEHSLESETSQITMYRFYPLYYK